MSHHPLVVPLAAGVLARIPTGSPNAVSSAGPSTEYSSTASQMETGSSSQLLELALQEGGLGWVAGRRRGSTSSSTCRSVRAQGRLSAATPRVWGNDLRLLPLPPRRSLAGCGAAWGGGAPRDSFLSHPPTRGENSSRRGDSSKGAPDSVLNISPTSIFSDLV